MTTPAPITPDHGENPDLSELPPRGGEIVACFGKVAYATLRDARKALRHMTRRPNWRRRERHATLQPYRCKFCGHAHLGNSRR